MCIIKNLKCQNVNSKIFEEISQTLVDNNLDTLIECLNFKSTDCYSKLESLFDAVKLNEVVMKYPELLKNYDKNIENLSFLPTTTPKKYRNNF